MRIVFLALICLALTQDPAGLQTVQPQAALPTAVSAPQSPVEPAAQAKPSLHSPPQPQEASAALPAPSLQPVGSQPLQARAQQEQAPTAQQVGAEKAQILVDSEAEALQEGLRKPTKLTLEDFLPSDDSSRVIKLVLTGILAVFATIQLLASVCSKKKKRYTEKFEEYSQRTEVEELDESID